MKHLHQLSIENVVEFKFSLTRSQDVREVAQCLGLTQEQTENLYDGLMESLEKLEATNCCAHAHRIFLNSLSLEL